MDISRETPEQTDARLRHVVRQTTLRIYDAPYRFVELPLGHEPAALPPEALAVVRDDEVASLLLPADAWDVPDAVALMRFHFPPGVDNSGFVGWLATRIKRATGSGVFVVCGQNSARGGIFDYWGVPPAAREAVFAEVRSLLAGAQAAGRPAGGS